MLTAWGYLTIKFQNRTQEGFVDIEKIRDDSVLADLQKSIKMVIERETRILERIQRQRASLAAEKKEGVQSASP